MTEPQKTIDVVDAAFEHYMRKCWTGPRGRPVPSRDDLRSAFMAGARFGVEAMAARDTRLPTINK